MTAPPLRRLAAALLTAALATTCRRAPSVDLAPRFTLGVSPGPGLTVLGATLVGDAQVAYRDARCLGVRLRDGREPPSLEGGRVEAWVVAGAVLGHVDRDPAGRYFAQVRGSLEPGVRVSASLAGSADVPEHRFRTPAVVPRAIRRTAPARGFTVRPGAPLAVAWAEGDGRDVMVLLTINGAAGDGYQLTCVAPRAAGRFDVPGAALATSLLPPQAREVSLVAVADDRVREGDYALDVTPVGSPDDEVLGAVAPR